VNPKECLTQKMNEFTRKAEDHEAMARLARDVVCEYRQAIGALKDRVTE